MARPRPEAELHPDQRLLLPKVASVISAPRTCSVQIRAGFAPYIQAFLPFLYPALKAHEDTQLCMVAVGTSSHSSRQPGTSPVPSTTPLITLNLWPSERASAITPAIFLILLLSPGGVHPLDRSVLSSYLPAALNTRYRYQGSFLLLALVLLCRRLLVWVAVCVPADIRNVGGVSRMASAEVSILSVAALNPSWFTVSPVSYEINLDCLTVSILRGATQRIRCKQSDVRLKAKTGGPFLYLTYSSLSTSRLHNQTVNILDEYIST
ncbi:hypothetical protein C8R48DRAFT_775101 [Suillus tomentosus]|nr:hypothetical protein C8R48DRAFT_775101 [Suillus tomentosus]